MRILKKALLLGLVLALAAVPPLIAEVWNDPAGVAVTATSQTITFPRPMSSVLVLNDDATNEIYIRLFWCGETAAAATVNSIEIKATKNRIYTHDATRETGLAYCAISLVCAATETATARIEGK